MGIGYVDSVVVYTPENVSAVCHDINQDIAKHYGILEREAFDKSRKDIVSELCGH